jgi:hypothetical protein
MQTLLSKSFVASVAVAGLGLLAAPQAQAASFADAGDFFLPGGPITIEDGLWKASGENSAPLGLFAPLNDWTVSIISPTASTVDLTVSRGIAGVVLPPATFQTWYQLESVNPIVQAFASWDLNGAGATGTLTKEIYSDAFFTNLVGTATVTTVNGNTISTGATFAGLNTLYIKDIINTQSGNLSSYTNSYAVPEPLTMLGASAAIAFGAAFKRRNANKG